MNSEIPPNRESDNTNLEPIELSEDRAEELSTEMTSNSEVELDVDMWDDDTLATFEQRSSADASGDLEPSSAIAPEESNWTSQAAESELSEPLSSSSEEIPLEDSQDNNNNRQTEADLPSAPPASEPELFVDSWLDEPENLSSSELSKSQDLAQTVDETDDLEQQKARLHQEIESLKAQKEQLLLQQIREVQENMGRMVEEGTKELKERKMALQIEIEKLERRKQRINQEMRSNFAGSSQELAVRVQGFKDYLVGSLQDLATAAEKLELVRQQESAPRRPARSSENPRREERRSRRREESPRARNSDRTSSTQFSEPTFADQSRRIRQLIDKYRNNPDYYGAPWQLRRTFEVAQAKTVQEWFFVQGGRGAVDSMGSRLQNILIASAVISILHSLYGDRCRVLVLTDTPENLGEWRRGLQDCLGISRSSFGTNRGVVLFDSPDVLVQRAERLLADKLLPIIVVDETEELLNLAILKFPLWLAFAATNKSTSSNYLY